MFFEVWKPVDGFQNYDVSNLGRVRNRTSGRIMMESYTRKYCYVHLRNGNKNYRKTVHRLVAMAFIPNPKGLPQINHKDENPGNNRVDNLEWCTISYNASYGNRNKNMLKSRAANNGPKRQRPVLRISGDAIKKYDSIMDAARDTGLDFSNISKCCRPSCYNKTLGGYEWKYAD